MRCWNPALNEAEWCRPAQVRWSQDMCMHDREYRSLRQCRAIQRGNCRRPPSFTVNGHAKGKGLARTLPGAIRCSKGCSPVFAYARLRLRKLECVYRPFFAITELVDVAVAASAQWAAGSIISVLNPGIKRSASICALVPNAGGGLCPAACSAPSCIAPRRSSATSSKRRIPAGSHRASSQAISGLFVLRLTTLDSAATFTSVVVANSHPACATLPHARAFRPRSKTP